MKWFAAIHLRMNALHKFTNTRRLLETPNKLKIEKMTYYLLNYDSVTIYLSIIIFIGTTQLKIQFVHNATSITGFANVLLVTP